jgi:Zn-dependent M28 family amino/carboxypeptidase
MQYSKYSPVKKKGGIVAGIPRASGERNSPTGVGVPSENKVGSSIPSSQQLYHSHYPAILYFI